MWHLVATATSCGEPLRLATESATTSAALRAAIRSWSWRSPLVFKRALAEPTRTDTKIPLLVNFLNSTLTLPGAITANLNIFKHLSNSMNFALSFSSASQRQCPDLCNEGEKMSLWIFWPWSTWGPCCTGDPWNHTAIQHKDWNKWWRMAAMTWIF